MGKLKVLIVEDEVIIAWNLKKTLERMESEVLSIAASADSAVQQARMGLPDLVLMDISLKGEKTGIDAAREIRSFSKVPIIYLTGNAHLLDGPLLDSTQTQGLYSKPPTDRQLREMLEIARGIEV